MRTKMGHDVADGGRTERKKRGEQEEDEIEVGGWS